MQKFNKATAAAIAGGIATVVGAVWVALDPEVLAAAQTVLTALLVYLVPNKDAA